MCGKVSTQLIRQVEKIMISRRDFLKLSGASAAALYAATHGRALMRALGAPLAPGLSDPALQPKFVNAAPNALDPGFIFSPKKGKIKVGVSQSVQMTGLVGTDSVTPVPTTIWGYGDPSSFYSWPGRTFEVQSGTPLEVKWENRLGTLQMPVTSFGRSVIDTSLHWAYSLHGYTQYSVEMNGVPIVPHVHGGHTDFQFDGNPEFFFRPDYEMRGA